MTRILAALVRPTTLYTFNPAVSTRAFASAPPDLYKTLGVGREATHAEIKSAFDEWTKAFKLEKALGDADAWKRYREIEGAYNVLSNYELRRLYNKGLSTVGNGSKSVHWLHYFRIFWKVSNSMSQRSSTKHQPINRRHWKRSEHRVFLALIRQRPATGHLLLIRNFQRKPGMPSIWRTLSFVRRAPYVKPESNTNSTPGWQPACLFSVVYWWLYAAVIFISRNWAISSIKNLNNVEACNFGSTINKLIDFCNSGDAY